MNAKQGGAAAPAKNPLDRPAASFGELKTLLARPDVIEQIKLTLPAHMKPERMAKIMLSAVNKTPKLMQVNQLSLLQVLGQLSEIGLEPGSAFGHVYLIPFENKKQGITTVNLIIGYKGLIELARRSGMIVDITAMPIYEGERWHYQVGAGSAQTEFLHEVNPLLPSRTPDKVILYYAKAELKGGGYHIEMMSRAEVLAIRDRSQGWQTALRFGRTDTPWHTDEVEMGRKTLIRRLTKYIPMSAELAEGLQLEDDSEARLVEAAREVQGTVIRKPPASPESGPSIGDQLGAAAAAAANENGAAEPPHNPDTGELTEPEPEPTPPPEEPEPDQTDKVAHLLWRIGRASSEAELSACITDAASLDKTEPRRLEVGPAVTAKRAAIRKVGGK